MAANPRQQPADKAPREERVAAALRENLRKRKQQEQARAINKERPHGDRD